MAFLLPLWLFFPMAGVCPLAPEEALIKLSFVHHGQRVAECRPYTADELAKLAPNMRAPLKCGRERA
jgi:hypothetical protein